MVELRKRPPRNDPPAPPPPAKKGRAAAAAATTNKKSKVTKPPAKKQSGAASKAKNAASRVTDTITEPVETDNAAKQATIEDEPDTAVATGEAGMIPETAATAPSTTTVPAEPPTGATGTDEHRSAVADTPVTPAAEPTAPAEAKDMTTPNVSAAASAATTSDEDGRPPATDDLEKPPETGNVASTDTAPPTAPAPATLPLSASSIGQQIRDLSTLGAPLDTHTGARVSVSSLLSSPNARPAGLIIFTYPRASTPGCTTQAQLFRDRHAQLTASDYTVYGLSTDSVKANAGFARKHALPYDLLCDAAGSAGLVAALGMRKGTGAGTVRGVVVLDGAGVVRVWVQAGPARTVDVVEEYLRGLGV